MDIPNLCVGLVPFTVQVGNAAFDAAYKYLVDLSYLWTSTMDLVFTTGASKLSNADTGGVYLLNDTITRVRNLSWPHCSRAASCYVLGALFIVQ